MPYYFWIVLLLTACSHIKPSVVGPPKDLKPHWIKNTYNGEIFTGTRVPHLMSPLIAQNFVFQGNGRDGLVVYHKTTGRKLWRKDIEGGVQGAIFHEGLLYLGGGDGFVYALKAKTGQQVWSYNLNVEVLQAPTFYKGHLYVLASNNTLHAFIASTGQRQWVYARKGTFPPLNIYGATPPLIYGDNILVGFSDGSLVSLTQDAGVVTWEKSLSQQSRFKNLYITLNENVLYVSSYDQDVLALDPFNGRVLWRVGQKGGASPVTLYQDHIFFSTSDGNVVAADATTGKVLWTHKLANASFGTRPLLFRNTLYVAQSNGPIVGLNKESGEQQVSYSQVNGALAPIGISEGKLYVMSRDGQLHVIRIID